MAEIKNKTAKNFFQMAQEYIAKLPADERNNLPIINRHNIDEINSWAYYFENFLHWTPAAFRSMLAGHTKSFTVPAQWPQWFDSRYVPPAWMPHVGGDRSSKATHETKDELQARLGRHYGLGGPPPVGSYPDLARRHGRPIGRFEQGTQWETYAGRPISERLPAGMMQVAEAGIGSAAEIPISDALKSLLARQASEDAA